MIHKNRDNYRCSDKRKAECCRDKFKDYEDGWAEIDAMIIADCEDYYNKISTGDGLNEKQ